MDGDGYSRELEDGWLARAQGDKLIKMATVPTFYLTSTAFDWEGLLPYTHRFPPNMILMSNQSNIGHLFNKGDVSTNQFYRSDR